MFKCKSSPGIDRCGVLLIPEFSARFSSSVIMSASYDYETKHDDPLVKFIGKSLRLAVQELRPEVATVFNAFPIRESLVVFSGLD